MVWILVMFLYSAELEAMVGEPVQSHPRYTVLERCLAAAQSERLKSLNDKQFICWPSLPTAPGTSGAEESH